MTWIVAVCVIIIVLGIIWLYLKAMGTLFKVIMTIIALVIVGVIVNWFNPFW